ncbi:hypothetical protein H9P43_003914 [Blastocladiella emersonii ATCC 22665]|nr:hypothetical protein H9P43_003914 [Blastocladiella emersonii ATCC 22665]
MDPHVSTIFNIQQWTRAAWNEQDRDHDAPTQPINVFLLVQALAIVALNGAIVLSAYRCRARIMTNAANRLAASLCGGYLGYGLCMTGIRLALLVDLRWPEPLCRLYESINLFFICYTVMIVSSMALERYQSIIKLNAMSVRQADQLTVGAMLLSVGDVLLHAIGHRSVISRSGLFCYPSSMATGIGYLDLILVTSQIVSVGGIYVAIVIRLRRTTRKLIKSTSQSAGSSSQPPISPTATASRAAMTGERLEIQTSSLLRAISMTIDSPHSSSILATAADPPSTSSTTTTATPKRPALTRAVTNEAIQLQSFKNTEVERRIVTRGILSLVALTFTVAPANFIIGSTLATGERTGRASDAWFAVSKFVSELADPIILLSMDARFRAAVRETCLWWLPGTQSHTTMSMASSRSATAL